MEHFVRFLKGFGVIALFMIVAMTAIQCIIHSPYIFFKVCGVVTIVVDFYVTIKRLQKELE
jgi:hypothetical protein